MDIETIQKKVSVVTDVELHAMRRAAERRERMFGLGWHDPEILAECDLELDRIANEFRNRAADAKLRTEFTEEATMR